MIPTDSYVVAQRDGKPANAYVKVTCGDHKKKVSRLDFLLAVAEHERWLKGDEKSRRLNLSNTDLSGMDMRYMDLRGADFSGAIFRQADLRGANLEGANLKRVSY